MSENSHGRDPIGSGSHLSGEATDVSSSLRGIDPSRGPASETLGEALPREMTRVRKLIPLYRSVPMGFLAANMMERSLDEAQRVLAEGDAVAMIRCYQDLKGYEA